MPEATVAAIIIKKINNVEHVLLTLRDHHPFKGIWCIPGGHIEKGESPIAAIIREVKEETELDFSGHFFNFFVEQFPEFNINNVVLVFNGIAYGDLPIRTIEVSKFNWVPLAESIKMDLAFRHQEALSAYFVKYRGLKMIISKKEIELLAEDVRNNIDQTIEIAKFSIAAATLIIAYSLSKIENGFLLPALACLLPIPILRSAVNMILNRRKNVMEKATYLRCFGGPEYVWELFLRKYREMEINRSSFSMKTIGIIKSMILISIGASFILILFASFKDNQSLHYLFQLPLFDQQAIGIRTVFIVWLAFLIWNYKCFIFRKLKEENAVIMGPPKKMKKGKVNKSKIDIVDNEKKTADLWLSVYEELQKTDSNRIPNENE